MRFPRFLSFAQSAEFSLIAERDAIDVQTLVLQTIVSKFLSRVGYHSRFCVLQWAENGRAVIF